MNETSNDFVNTAEQVRLQQTCVEIFNLYSSTFRHGRTVPVILIPPAKANEYLQDNIDGSIPRGKYSIAVALMGSKEQQRITRVEFKGDTVLFVRGDPNVVDPQHPEQVFPSILSHELVHSQIVPRPIVGANPTPLLPRDIHFGKDIHYVLGFKAFSIDLKTGQRQEPTKPLDEYITQYLAMIMTDSFENRSPVFDKIKSHGLGISAEYVIAAEILNDIFKKHNINPQTVEQFHHQSDIKGFLEMLRKIDSKLSGIILKAGIDTNPKTSIKTLKQLS